MEQGAQQAPEVVEDQAEIVTSAAQQCVDRVAARPGEEVAIKLAVGLHVADHRLDGAASPELAADRRGGATALAGDEHAAMIQAVPAIATIDVAAFHRAAGQAFDLSEAEASVWSS